MPHPKSRSKSNEPPQASSDAIPWDILKGLFDSQNESLKATVAEVGEVITRRTESTIIEKIAEAERRNQDHLAEAERRNQEQLAEAERRSQQQMDALRHEFEKRLQIETNPRLVASPAMPHLERGDLRQEMEDTPRDGTTAAPQPHRLVQDEPVPYSSQPIRSLSVEQTSPNEHPPTVPSYATMTNHVRHPKIDRFTGSGKSIRARDWIALFEAATETYTDAERRASLIGSLADDALTWYAQEVAPIHGISWPEVRTRFLSRFGTAVVDPLVSAEKRRMSTTDTVLSYSQEKLALLRQAGVVEKSAIASLTEGLPFSYRQHLLASRPRTYDDWLEIALSLEHSITESFRRQKTRPSINAMQESPVDRRPTPESNTDDPPPYPCRFCKKRGLQRLHWHNECPNRTSFECSRKPNRTSARTFEKRTDENRTNPKTAVNNGTARAANNIIDNQPQLPFKVDLESEVNNIQPHPAFLYFTAHVNGHRIRAFLDTGSTLTVISKQVADSLDLKIDPASATSISHVCGSGRSYGITQAELTIGSITINIPIHVLGESSLDLLVGIREARRFGLRADLKRHCLEQEDGNTNVSLAITEDNESQIISESGSAPVYVQQNSMTGPLAIPEPIPAPPNPSDRIFAQNSNDVGRINATKHYIRLAEGARPISLRPYRQSPAVNARIDEHVSKLLAAGVIRPSVSPWAFPVRLAPKEGGERFCVDFRKLNEVTIDEHTPLPYIYDLLDKVALSSVFTTLDLAWGYWQVPLEDDSIEKTAFVTASGQYEFIVMPFGLKNAPSTFQRIIRNVLRQYIGKGVENYLDDIIVHTQTVAAHQLLLRAVLRTLHDANLRLRFGKCKFFAREVEWLGHTISYRSIRPVPKTIKAVIEFPQPRTQKQVQQFVGLANYYRNFVPHFSIIAAPLYDLMKKDIPFEWSSRHQESFDNLRRLLTSKPVLVPFDPSRRCRLLTDASGIGLGAILSQLDDHGKERVVSYYSKKLSEVETRYTVAEQECYAIVSAIKNWRHYLEGQVFDIFTDNASLRWILNIRDPTGRLFRWSTFLSTYNFVMHHRPGSTNQAADALSRNPVLCIIDNRPKASEIEALGIKAPLSTDSEGRILVNLATGPKIVVPPSEKSRLLRSLHDDMGHPGIHRTRNIVASEYWWPGWALDVVDYVRTCHECQLTKPPNVKPLGMLQPIETPEVPNMIWAMDTIVVGSDAKNTAAKYVQLIVDHHSRFVFARATRSNNSEATIATLRRALETSGPPEETHHRQRNEL